MGDPGAGTDELVTERLLLRPLRESDLAALAAIYADPAVMRFLGGPRTLEATRTGLGWIIAAHREQGFGLWATTLRADATLDRPLRHPRPGRRGRDRARDRLPPRLASGGGTGYATEAAAAIRDHARSQLGLDRLISLIDPENVASQAVALRIGMRHERDLIFEGRPTSLFAYLRVKKFELARQGPRTMTVGRPPANGTVSTSPYGDWVPPHPIAASTVRPSRERPWAKRSPTNGVSGLAAPEAASTA